jgi:hypothetical protein
MAARFESGVATTLRGVPQVALRDQGVAPDELSSPARTALQPCARKIRRVAAARLSWVMLLAASLRAGSFN